MCRISPRPGSNPLDTPSSLLCTATWFHTTKTQRTLDHQTTVVENFQIPPSIGTSCPLELSPFIMSMAAPLTSSGPALTSAWLLPSASVNYFQPVIASSYTYQHCSEKLGGLQPYEFLSHTGSGAAAPQPEIVMVFKEIRHTNVVTSDSPAICYSGSVQANMKMCFQGTQDPPLLSLASPDSPELLASTEHPIPENPGSEDALLGKCHPSLQDPGTLDKGIESSPGWADIGALVEGIQLPQVLQSLEDLDHSNQLTTIGAQDTDSIQDNGVQVPSAKVRKKKHKASEAITGASEAKLQLMDLKSLPGGKGCVFSAAASDRAPKDTVEKSYRKSPMMPSNRTNQDEGHGKGRAKKTKGNNEKKALDRKQSEPKVKAEDMPTIPNRKRKRHQPVTGQEGRSWIRKVEGFSRALGASSITKDLKISTSKSCPGVPCEGKIPRDDAQNPPSTAEAGASSASLCELPPPGQVKLIPLSFPSPEKPPSRPICRRPQPPASRQPTIAPPSHPAATDTAQPSQTAAGNTSLMHPIKPAQPVLNNASQAGLTWKTQPRVPQPAVSKPASRATSPCSSLRRAPVAAALTKRCSSPPQQRHPYLIEDFSHQRIPWREPNISQPVLSTPITQEQRPEREAMKRQAQLQRELAAKYTSLGKLQFFRQRETDMEIAQYYGYVR
ncbi:hypothetical protein GW7_11424 [Heterocephalus glaber]|uniref:DUF4629 domain-containing protein n=1 Tax=Heterocephalus glaber TaxID=10181 RepID=G5BDP6_HETGA|nr:hypothetical protein GW7_11424 [Heterocephalus glaber]